MTSAPSPLAILIFLAFVGLTLGISFYLGRQAKSSAGYFAAHGQIPWFVNGVAFAGDYLSAASFLGICGMIAFYGYDGFLYSIGYLAGWIVALFVVAEPMKRLGKFTFADALNSRFSSRGIKLSAGVSTLAVSIFYLIPQMVGAGALVQPLLGLPHWAGVLMVGAVVILIVVTAGMVSTTWVQFLKGGLLVAFSGVLTAMILNRGLSTAPTAAATQLRQWGPFARADLEAELTAAPELAGGQIVPADDAWKSAPFLRTREANGKRSVWSVAPWDDRQVVLLEAQWQAVDAQGKLQEVNGQPVADGQPPPQLLPVGRVRRLPDGVERTGPLGPLAFLSTLQRSEIILWGTRKIVDSQGNATTVYFQKPTPGSQVLRPGEHPTFHGIRSSKLLDKLNFISLMLALFCGTASLPHILIRYYTVKDEAAARKSTIVGIGCIGMFYVLTLYMGLGAMTSGSMDVRDSNMAAPLLARGLSELLFAVISAIAFTTVLGTVSGLILASAGAVTHDLLESVSSVRLTDSERVRVAKIASCFIGAISILLGIWFKELNVSYLVGWAFSVAASANLPALVMLLFWKRTTRYGIIAAVVVGMLSSLAWILLSADTFEKVYGLPGEAAWAPFSQPGIVTIPLGFLTLVVASLATPPEPESAA